MRTKFRCDDVSQMTRRGVARLSLGAALTGLGLAAAATPAEAGWGHCSVNGCPCQEFVTTPGYPDNCQNCGHRYTDHW